jgi:hypothetical protein
VEDTVRILLAALVVWCAADAVRAQPVDPALNIAIEQVCTPFVLEGAAEEEIPALQGIAPAVRHYRIGEGVLVRLNLLGHVRVCTVLVDRGDVAAYRAAIMEAAARWPNPLTYRGDVPHGIGFTRAEMFCPEAEGPRTSWMLMSRDSGALLSLSTMSAATRNCPSGD